MALTRRTPSEGGSVSDFSPPLFKVTPLGSVSQSITQGVPFELKSHLPRKYNIFMFLNQPLHFVLRRHKSFALFLSVLSSGPRSAFRNAFDLHRQLYSVPAKLVCPRKGLNEFSLCSPFSRCCAFDVSCFNLRIFFLKKNSHLCLFVLNKNAGFFAFLQPPSTLPSFSHRIRTWSKLTAVTRMLLPRAVLGINI